MTTNPEDAGLSRRREDGTSDGRITKASTGSPWIRSKDPRIVRVSRAFGGKDRHSKVCTIKGLRDRRVRLSVPTAVQLYDLQEKLGLNQPSKVVDWLLNAAKNEIDELPPLPVAPEIFCQNYQSILTSHQAASSSLDEEGLKRKNITDLENSRGLFGSNVWGSNSPWKAKSKEVVSRPNSEEGKEEETLEGNESLHESPSSNFLRKAYHPPFQGLMNTAMSHYGSYPPWEPPNISLSHLGSHGLPSQAQSLPSPLSLSTGTQFLVYPSGSTPIHFPSNVATSVERDPRQIKHIQMLSTSSNNVLSNPLNPNLFPTSQSMRPLHFVVSPKDIPYDQDSATIQPIKSQGFHSN